MKKVFQSESVMRVIRIIKPWATAALIIVVLRYTGMLAAVTDFAGATAMKTGFMDFEPDETLKKETFDFGFTVKDLQGAEVDIRQFKGKVVFLNLWATWCGPCRSEMPSIEGLYNEVGSNKNVVFVMLSMDRPEHTSKVVKYIADKKFTFPTYVLSGNLTEQLQGVTSIPTTFIIDTEGKIASRKVGAANYDNGRTKEFIEELAAPSTTK